MVQFHPTALAAGIDPMPLISEAVRGEGAVIVNEAGKKVIANPLAARDVVTRAEWNAMLTGHQIFLDARENPGERLPARFPSIQAICKRVGIDPCKDLIPISPAAHYHMGGVRVDYFGRTNVPGLFAAGEVSSTGLHGANRLASNSLLEAVVCGRRIGKYLGLNTVVQTASINSKARQVDSWLSGSIDAVARQIGATVDKLEGRVTRGLHTDPGTAEVRAALTRGAGVLRTAETLTTALDELRPHSHTDTGLIAYLIAWSALRREESRGGHTRLDFPYANEIASHTVVNASEILAQVRR
jgi:L-aspartate oxidase